MNELQDAYLPETEVLAQLAEEAAELAQAALKLRRVLDGTNPTPLSESEARAALAEERTDVSLCVDLLQIEVDKELYRKKYDRWRWRLLARMDNAQKQVVHCKDCAHWRHNLENDTHCFLAKGLSDPEADDFCSYGKPKKGVVYHD